MKDPNTIFLAHASEDKPFVRKLYKTLKENGLNPWFDEEDLPPGVQWDKYIQKVIRESTFFIICFSKQSLKKTGYVQKEIRTALAFFEQKPPNSIYLIPALIDDIELPDLSVGTINLIDYQAAKLFKQEGVLKLIYHLQKQLNLIQDNKQGDKKKINVSKEDTKEKINNHISGNNNTFIQGGNGNTIKINNQ